MAAKLPTYGQIKDVAWQKVVRNTYGKSIYKSLYKSYWRTKFIKPSSGIAQRNYFTARPHPGAGIGHQMANWIAGYWFAKQFGLQYAHYPFSSPAWENLLGFSHNETDVDTLVRLEGRKKIYLPKFDEYNQADIEFIHRIIESYSNEKVVFVAEQDQFYHDQYGVIDELKEKFYINELYHRSKLTYTNDTFNIAIHIRRGDITSGRDQNSNLSMRWQDDDYFENVLSNVLDNLSLNKPISVYLFSQGEKSNFASFDRFKNVNYCLHMGAQESFLHMVYADLLITSKSSFSYKPALLNKGVKVCPRNFWHGYPQTSDWILAEENGAFDVNLLATKS
ncbi:hypothetical protein GGR92_001110 [Spirosoma lacussanchae]|uniref:hypothetical protein n=1 Tax=Spirosoma lacussanchae TaxID=1884249 RepID=UPI001107D6A6|nr:hypothetical protein [Spirosoma lacussanchae]